jgi:chromatin remodeling complex protein RSC6
MEGDGMAAKKKVAFGGYAINFKGCSESLEEIMGPKPIGPSEMTKKIWAYVKKKRLGKK